ncbi:MAG: hypothetical protein WCT01_00480 [Candidatus Shapirobacteria bacterium]
MTKKFELGGFSDEERPNVFVAVQESNLQENVHVYEIGYFLSDKVVVTGSEIQDDAEPYVEPEEYAIVVIRPRVNRTNLDETALAEIDQQARQAIIKGCNEIVYMEDNSNDLRRNLNATRLTE